MNAALTADLVESTTSGVLAGEVEEVGDVERGSSGVLAEEPFQHVKESWDCSQVENEPEERSAMDWLMNDEIMRRWSEVSKDEEETTVKRCESGKLQVEKVQRAPELVVART